MSQTIKKPNMIRQHVRKSVAAVTLAGLALAAQPTMAKPDETTRHRLQFLTQLFDGSQEFSHSQQIDFSRARQGNESYVMLDYQDSDVVIEKDGRNQVGNFVSTSGVEAAYRYDYATHTMSGGNAMAKYYNGHIRQHLDQGPEFGENANWTRTFELDALALGTGGGSSFQVELERTYFTHEDQDLVMVRYTLPAFEYKSRGEMVLHWGEGIAVLDAAMSQILWKASDHQALLGDNAIDARPYRYANTIAQMRGDSRIPVTDPRQMPLVAAHFDRIYAADKKRAMPFEDAGQLTPDQTPLLTATMLDAFGFALAENSGNQLFETLANTILDATGNTTKETKADAKLNDATISDTLTIRGNIDAGMKVVDIVGNPIAANQTALIGATYSTLDTLSNRAADTAETLNYFIKDQESLEFLIETAPNAATRNGLLVEYGQNANRIVGLEKEVANITKDLSNASQILKKLPVEQVLEVFQKVGDSKAGKLLNFLGLIDDGVKVGKIGLNVYEAAAGTAGTGTLNLTRNYATFTENADGSVSYNGLGKVAWETFTDFAGIVGDGLKGGPVGAAKAAVIVTFGAGTDIFVSGVGVIQATDAQTEAIRTETGLIRQRTADLKIENAEAERQRENRDSPRDITKDNLYTGGDDPNAEGYYEGGSLYDPKTGELREEYLSNIGDGSNRATRAEPGTGGSLPPEPKKTAEEIQQEFQDSFRRDYPTARRRDPRSGDAPQADDPKAPVSYDPSGVADVVSDILTGLIGDNGPPPPNDNGDERTISFSPMDLGIETTEAFNGGDFDSPEWTSPVWEPVSWTSPEWTPPEWNSPEWVPPEFDPVTSVPVTFSGFETPSIQDDWLGDATDNLAFDYGDLSGTVATDLEPYEEFLALHDMRNLERLALKAGYPNLASALKDAPNLMRNADDPGFRKWAMTPPACGGIIGCGPNYLGRFHMKASQLELGLLIGASRDLFSTGGFEDITIAGFDFKFTLSDFGLEDGDIVALMVTQFGETLFETQLTLTNAGNSFSSEVNPGVVTLVVTAINEGDISPNTAAVGIEDVKDGSGAQEFSLTTGGTGTLRVETGG